MEKEIICFKSDTEFFYKEKKGFKRNTIRRMRDCYDPRYNILLRILNLGPEDSDYIQITLSGSLLKFRRKIRDVSYWGGYWIISW